MMKTVFFSGSFFRCIFLLVFLIYILLCWNFRILELPGLHGDEAWMGIEANSYLHQGKVHLLGMNNYTGILQSSASALSFKIFGTGIFGLRIAGPAFNFLAVLILALGIKKRDTAILFLVIALQSSLLLISPRIAWEVNTFTLFFLSLALISILKITENIEKENSGWTFLFLLVNILGTYNHVIFLCIPISAFIGLVAWTFLERDFSFIKLIIIFLVNLVNLILTFLLMKYGMGSFWSNSTYFFVLGIISLLFIEISFFAKIHNIRVNITSGFKSYIPGLVVFGLLLNFLHYHGLALFEVFSNYKLLTHVYSYQHPWFTKTVFIVCGIAVMSMIVYFLFQDIKKGGKAAIPAAMIISYLSTFSLFTTNNSMRYYLGIYAIFSIYLASKINLRLKTGKMILAVLIIAVLLNNITIWKIYLNDNHNIAAIKVKVGRDLIEDSGHFLPKAPLIKFLRDNRVGLVYYDTDRYFLEQPVSFYKLTDPWKENKDKRALIDFNYNRINKTGGFVLIIK